MEVLQARYVLVGRRSNLGGVLLLVLARRDAEPFVQHVYTSGENTGVAGGWRQPLQGLLRQVIIIIVNINLFTPARLRSQCWRRPLCILAGGFQRWLPFVFFFHCCE